MSAATDNVTVFGYGLALLAHAGFAGYLLATGRSVWADKRAGWPFLAALALTSLWAAARLATAHRLRVCPSPGLSGIARG